MTERTPSSHTGSLRKQAVRWIVRLNSGTATPGDRREFEAWLAAGPEHRHEFEQLSRMWAALDGTQSLLTAEIAKAEQLWERYTANRQAAGRWSWRSVAWPAAGAAALVLMLVTAWWWMRLPEVWMYETAKGAQRQVTLADGSMVMLNTDTRLTVQFSSRTRLIRLGQGEAWFTVRHDERRPFTVQVANGTIRDIGTQFMVNKAPQAVRVNVWEGVVEVGLRAPDESGAAAHPAILREGQQVSYDEEGRMSDIRSFDREMVGSWKDGKLIFRSQPLKQVLTEVARYRPEEIRLLDPSLEEFPVSGVFHIHDLEHVIPILEDALPIRAHRVGTNLIVVERPPASSTGR